MRSSPLPSVQYETPRPESCRGEAIGARSFIEAVHPFQFAGLGVQRDHSAPRSRRGVHRAVDFQRRSLKLVFWPRAEIVGLEVPGNLKLVEIGRVDLILR